MMRGASPDEELGAEMITATCKRYVAHNDGLSAIPCYCEECRAVRRALATPPEQQTRDASHTDEA